MIALGWYALIGVALYAWISVVVDVGQRLLARWR